MLRSAVIISALVLPTVSMAQCLTSSDLETGITVTYENAEVDTYFASQDGKVRNLGADNNPEESTEWDIMLSAGIFELSVLERTVGKWHPTSEFALEYDFDIAAVASLNVGDVGGGKQTLVEEGFSEPATYSYSVHAGEDVVLGDCTYAALDVYQTYILPEADFGLTKSTYLPELGFGFLVRSKWPFEEAVSRVITGITAGG